MCEFNFGAALTILVVALTAPAAADERLGLPQAPAQMPASTAAALDEEVAVRPTGPAVTHGYCGDDLEKGWNFYCDRERRKRQIEPQAVAPQVPPPAIAPPAPQPAEEFPYTAKIEAYRKQLDETRARAILEPTPENVENYMRAQKEMTDIASSFTDTWQRVLWKTPDLDINSEYPITATGGAVYQDQKRVALDSALVEAAGSLGFLVVIEDQSVCGLCAPQLDILVQLQQRTGIEVMAVSRDGSFHPQYPDAVIDAGQLTSLGLTELQAPFIALVEPNSGAVELLGAGLITEDQILERVYVLTKVPEGERY